MEWHIVVIVVVGMKDPLERHFDATAALRLQKFGMDAHVAFGFCACGGRLARRRHLDPLNLRNGL